MLLLLLRRLLFALLVVLWPTRALAADDFGAQAAGTSVYDRLGVLSAPDVSRLQAHIGGRPYVVYLRSKAATASETESDARALMDAWSVESTPGARDGAVLLVNFDPADAHHGQVAIYAGQALQVPSARLKSITDAMAPTLRGGNTEAALEQGVDGIQTAVTQPSASAPVSTGQGLPWAVLALIIGIGGMFFGIPLFVFAVIVWVLVRLIRGGGLPGRSGSGWSGWSSGSSGSGSSFSSGGGSSSTSDGGSSGSSSF